MRLIKRRRKKIRTLRRIKKELKEKNIRFINIKIFTNFQSYIIKIKLFLKIDKY